MRNDSERTDYLQPCLVGHLSCRVSALPVLFIVLEKLRCSHLLLSVTLCDGNSSVTPASKCGYKVFAVPVHIIMNAMEYKVDSPQDNFRVMRKLCYGRGEVRSQVFNISHF